MKIEFYKEGNTKVFKEYHDFADIVPAIGETIIFEYIPGRYRITKIVHVWDDNGTDKINIEIVPTI